EAVPHLQAVLAREPQHCQALFALAQSHCGLQQPEQAVPVLQTLVTRYPGWRDYAAWHKLIAVRCETGDPGGAVALCRDLVRLAQSLQHKCLLAEHLINLGEKAEACKVVEQGLDDYRYLSGVSRRRDGRWVGKAKQLRKQCQ